MTNHESWYAVQAAIVLLVGVILSGAGLFYWVMHWIKSKGSSHE